VAYRVRVAEASAQCGQGRWVMRGSPFSCLFKVCGAPNDETDPSFQRDPRNPNKKIEYRERYTKRAAEQMLAVVKVSYPAARIEVA
jgi:hypothetical protein